MGIVKGAIFLIALFSLNGYAEVPLTEFVEDEVISSLDINDNFSALKNALPVSGPNYVQLGETLIVYGVISVPGYSFNGVATLPGTITAPFARPFASTPVVTVSISNNVTSIRVDNITNTGFQAINWSEPTAIVN